MRYAAIVAPALAGYFFAATAIADDYDFEFGLSYGKGQTDTTAISTSAGVPTPSLGVSTSSSDSDNFDLSGAWYYSGLSDTNTLKPRAAFLNRASSISLGYSRTDESGSVAFTGGSMSPPASGSTDATINELSVRLRHVWRDSGWYVLAGISSAEAKFDGNANGVVGSSEFNLTAYTLGVGKYLGKGTAVDLSVAEADTRGGSATNYALSFSHIGSIGKEWQYGVDVGITRSDDWRDKGSYALRGLLYPSSDFEFGIGLSRQQLAGGFERDTIEVFASWFVRDNIELMAQYRRDNPDSVTGWDTDNDLLGVGARVRF